MSDTLCIQVQHSLYCHLLKCLKYLTVCVCTADLSSSSLGRL